MITANNDICPHPYSESCISTHDRSTTHCVNNPHPNPIRYDHHERNMAISLVVARKQWSYVRVQGWLLSRSCLTVPSPSVITATTCINQPTNRNAV